MALRSQFRYLKRFLRDLILLILAVFLSYYVRSLFVIEDHHFNALRDYLSYMFMLSGSWLLFLYIYGFYGTIAIDSRTAVSKALFQVNYHSFLLVAIVSFVLHLTATNRAIFLLFTVCANLIVLATHRYSTVFRGVHYAIIGGDSKGMEASQLAHDIFPAPRSKCEGFFSPEIVGSAWGGDLSFRGSMQQLFGLLADGSVDTLIVAVPDDFPDTQRLLDDLAATDVDVLIAEKTKARMQFVLFY